jgi:hypothetical protein
MTHSPYPAASLAGCRRRFPLWVPILLVWALLLLFVVLLTPLVFVACLILRVNPFRGVTIYWELFSSLRGLRIVVEDPGAPVSIRIF